MWVRCTTVPAGTLAVCGADLAGAGQVVGTPLMVVDPSDGTVLSRQVLPAGTLWAVAAEDLVVATPVADDDSHTHWEVRATDPRDRRPTLAGRHPLVPGPDDGATATPP